MWSEARRTRSDPAPSSRPVSYGEPSKDTAEREGDAEPELEDDDDVFFEASGKSCMQLLTLTAYDMLQAIIYSSQIFLLAVK